MIPMRNISYQKVKTIKIKTCAFKRGDGKFNTVSSLTGSGLRVAIAEALRELNFTFLERKADDCFAGVSGGVFSSKVGKRLLSSTQEVLTTVSCSSSHVLCLMYTLGGCCISLSYNKMTN